jgi:hypothetical protein
MTFPEEFGASRFYESGRREDAYQRISSSLDFVSTPLV